MEKIYKEIRHENFRDIVNYSARVFPKRIAFDLRTPDGKPKHITYAQLGEYYRRLTTFLLDNGFEGKRIAVTGKNCYEWALTYLCAATVGVVVPIDKELSDEDVKAFLDSAECALMFTDSRFSLQSDDCAVISFEEAAKLAAGEEFSALGISGSDYPLDEWKVNGIDIGRNEMRVLIFTSGTTGNSKGVCLSQHNICSDIFFTVSVVKITSRDHVLSILPLHHTYECSLDFLLVLSRGATISYADSLNKIAANALEYQPTALVVVPELLNFMAKRIKKSVAKGCPEHYRGLFEELEFHEAMEKLPFIVRSTIRKKVRKTLGGKLRLFIVGAADVDPSIVKDFEALGIRTLQGYGLTECSPLLVGNNDFYFNPDSTGVPVPGVEIKIDSPNEEGIGEILARGENIMLGYYRDEEATAAVFKDGWFCTGDLGKLGNEGELYITGRKKNVIVTENGKNIYPEELESRLSEYPEIAEVLVHASTERGKPCVKAKILPSEEYMNEKLGHRASYDEMKEAVLKAVEEMNRKLPNYKRIALVEVLTEPLEKTTTRKIRRFGANVE